MKHTDFKTGNAKFDKTILFIQANRGKTLEIKDISQDSQQAVEVLKNYQEIKYTDKYVNDSDFPHLTFNDDYSKIKIQL